MLQFNISKVYREDWKFNMVVVEDYFIYDNDLIENDDVDGAEELDYIWSDQYEYCKYVDDALYTIEYGLYDLFESRINVDYKVVTAFVRYIQEFWNEGDWGDAISAVDDVKRGYYDDEMLSYDAYLKVESMLQELREYSMSYTAVGEKLQEVTGVVDIRDEVVTMLETVREKLKNDEYHVDFESGELQEHL